MSTPKNNNNKPEQKALKIGATFVNPLEITFIAGVGNYSMIHFKDGTQKLTCRTLKYFEKLLLDIPFIRPSKSFLVNPHYIKSVELKTNKTIILGDDNAIGISRRNVAVMKAYFSL